jgi:hypothetical protein
MSGEAMPYDGAVMESLFSSLKPLSSLLKSPKP